MTDEVEFLEEDKPTADEARDEESLALIEAFLGQHGAPVEGTDLDREAEGLPEGHRSGFAALIGRPNAGKSTLVNALVGQKIAIVSSKPQTTRSRLLGIVTRPDYQLLLVDTPGIHKNPAFRLNRRMIEQAVAAIPDADVILFLVDLTTTPREEDMYIATLLRQKAARRPVLLVGNKCDRVPGAEATARLEAYHALLPESTPISPISALEGSALDTLLDAIVARLPAGPRYYPNTQITDQTERHIAAELIREAVLNLTRQEVPHASAVLIEEFEERENGITYIAATIWVERDSQKPILIGKGGEKLKRIGSAARAELERFIGGQVYLDLWVKVKPKWRDDPARLRELEL